MPLSPNPRQGTNDGIASLGPLATHVPRMYFRDVSEVSVRPLIQDTAGVLARVESGERLTRTELGHAMAHLAPVSTGLLADLVARGTVKSPSVRTPLPAPGGPVRDDAHAGDLLEQMRDDERS